MHRSTNLSQFIFFSKHNENRNMQYSNMTLKIRHRTSNPPTLGSPLSWNMPKVTYLPAPDRDLMDLIDEIVSTGSQKGIISEVARNSQVEGYTLISISFDKEAPRELVEEFAFNLQERFSSPTSLVDVRTTLLKEDTSPIDPRLAQAFHLIQASSEELRLPAFRTCIENLHAGFIALGQAIITAMPNLTFLHREAEKSIRKLKRYKKHRKLFKKIEIKQRQFKRARRRASRLLSFQDTSRKRNPNRRKWKS